MCSRHDYAFLIQNVCYYLTCAIDSSSPIIEYQLEGVVGKLILEGRFEVEGNKNSPSTANI